MNVHNILENVLLQWTPPPPPHKMGLIPLSEPVGGSAPKFASASKGSIFVHAEHEAIVQLCPAQASPLPTFR